MSWVSPLPYPREIRAQHCLAITWIALAITPLYAGQSPTAPVVHPSDQRYLTQVARRTMERFLTDHGTYEPTYHPPSLAEMRYDCVVGIRHGGELRVTGVGSAAPTLLEACRNAAFAAVETAVNVEPLTVASLDDVLLSIEVVGTPVPFDLPNDVSDPEVLEKDLEPGIHGVILSKGGLSKTFLPSEIVYKNVLVTDALLSLNEQLSSGAADLTGMTARLFRTCEWHEQAPGEKVIELRRGMRIIAPEEVTSSAVSEAIERLAEYMRYRQRADGSFSYQYEPSLDHYMDEDNPVRQAGAAWALSVYARRSGDSAAQAASGKAIQRLVTGIEDVPWEEGPAYVLSPDMNPKAGLTALTCLALTDHPDAERFIALRDRLATGLLWLQQEDGRFLTVFPPSRKVSSQTYFPGETLLALARVYEQRPQAEILTSADKALAYYRRFFRDDPAPPFVAWQMQAFATLAEQTKRRDYTDFVFEMADWLIQFQVAETDSSYPELWGGIASYRPGRVGISTAAYLEGLADALRLARKEDDGQRAERYERAVRSATRFVLQLQFRPEEAYYVRSPKDAVWGMRTTPTVNLLRIDHCQHALAALMKSRELLFESEP